MAKIASFPTIEPAKRGRPPKRPAQERIFGMTLRIPASMRRALRHIADRETDFSGNVVSVHDVVTNAIIADLARRGIVLKDDGQP